MSERFKALPYSYKKPIVWVDTNVVIDMARAKHGSSKDKQAHDRSTALYDKLYELTQNNKIIYLEGEQRGEYGNNPKLLEECDKLQTTLSQGVSVQHPRVTRQFQMQRMMSVYCGKEKQFELKDVDIFSRDPIEEYNFAKKHGVIISVRFPITDTERQKNLKLRDKIISEWEAMRLVKLQEGVSYLEELEMEYGASYDFIQKILAQAVAIKASGRTQTFEELLVASDVLNPVHWWGCASGKKFDFVGFRDFMSSEAYRLIPHVKIQSELLAYLVTTTQSVNRGDRGDADQLSIVIPYCDFIITDRAVKHRLEVLGVPGSYKTSIYALNNFNEIMDCLVAL
jgi:hypothetical protein